jgi:tRNA-dihydrouridine synthase
VRTIPVIGNGDVRTVADAARMLEETGCAGVSIGRGALANPWIFRQLAAWEATGSWPAAGSFDERLALFRRQLELRIAQLGPERAIPSIRPTAHWHLKAMRVPAALRNRYQQARTEAEAARVLAEIEEHGPQGAARNGTLPDLAIPVPRGPVEHW